MTDTKKYDRQIRLWGIDAQQRLEATKICILGGTPTASEFLKNIVLPGIGGFTIVDDAKVTKLDVASNFYIPADSVGKDRAEVVCKALNEYNDSVKGEFLVCNYEDLFEKNPEFFTQFALVVVAGKPFSKINKESFVYRLSEYLDKIYVPLFFLSLSGNMLSFGICALEHPIFFGHPNTPQYDLRITEPFDELHEYAKHFTHLFDKEKKLSVEEKLITSHTPFIVLLMNAYTIFKEKNGREPVSSDTKQLQAILDGMRTEPYENFIEARSNIKFLFRSKKLSQNSSNLFEMCDKKLAELSTVTCAVNQRLVDLIHFFVLVKAVKMYYEENKTLPVCGSIPDMTATTQLFLELKKLYRTKADKDAAIVHKFANEVLSEFLKKASFSTKETPFLKELQTISMDKTKDFTKEFNSIGYIEAKDMSKPIKMDYDTANCFEDHTYNEVTFTAPTNPYCWLAALETSYAFSEKHGRAPNAETDIPELQTLSKEVIAYFFNAREKIELPAEICKEICRGQNVELNAVASFIGGMAAQEGIKVITTHFIPLDNIIFGTAGTWNITKISKTMVPRRPSLGEEGLPNNEKLHYSFSGMNVFVPSGGELLSNTSSKFAK